MRLREPLDSTFKDNPPADHKDTSMQDEVTQEGVTLT